MTQHRLNVPLGALVHAASAAAWRKSSYSGSEGNCVEVAGDLPGAVAVRDSKNPEGPGLVFNPDTWTAFVSRVRGGWPACR
jgi:uncharacterized protein DUF397